MFKLGEVLKEKITGFQGVVMVRSEYFTGCTHYGLCSQKLKDGKVTDWEWFDETRLVRVKGTKRVMPEPLTPTSGPHPNGPEA